MFKSLRLRSTYSSYEVDIGKEFYSPVINECVSYDRATAYFSAKALASYGKGLENFGRKGNQMRLIVSTEIDKATFDEMKSGYALKEKISAELADRLREELNLEEEKNISNLAYLISLGIIDIRMAFTPQGIFHDKFGIMEDENGDTICFRGSNNETPAAFEKNYESFDITCSWRSSEFDYEKITQSRKTFIRLWNDNDPLVCTRELDKLLYDEIQLHNKGRIIHEPLMLDNNCAFLDYEEGLILSIRIDPSVIINSTTYKLRLKMYVQELSDDRTQINFKDNLSYLKFKKIISVLEKDSEKKKYRFYVTDRLKSYISERELYIEERSRVGLAIKNHSPEILEKYASYKEIVNSELDRPLREQQMWDSFFMCSMKKASNFSVPGSGKTASVLGVFAYLRKKDLVDKIMMVGPKNSFGSWKDEFQLSFGNKLRLRYFDIQNEKYKSVAERKNALLFESGNANLILLNYECLRTYINEVKGLLNHRTLLVFDEVHKVKAIDGSNATMALELSKGAVYTLALTGTPIPNSYADIRNLLDILYHDEYDDFFGFDLQQLRHPSDRDIDEINRKLQPFFCRTTKRQLLVPDANKDEIYSVNATEAENELFHILCNKYAKCKLALIIRILQLESNPRMLLSALDLSDFSDILDISGEIDEIDYIDYSKDVEELIDSIDYTEKFKACIDLALEKYRQHKPVIIWCIFQNSIYRLTEELQKLGIKAAYIFGPVGMEERQSILEGFKAGKFDVLITNPHTLAESVSLHSICHDAIYFEYSYNLVHLLQSKDRIHRLGLPEGQYTQYYYMEENFSDSYGDSYSLDDRILERLHEKEQTMLDAIENHVLEKVTTTEEDLELIFKGLKL